MDLSDIICDIVQHNLFGIEHKAIVAEILKSGYEYKGETSLSQAVHQILIGLVKCGVIQRKDESLTRKYHGKRFVNRECVLS